MLEYLPPFQLELGVLAFGPEHLTCSTDSNIVTYVDRCGSTCQIAIPAPIIAVRYVTDSDGYRYANRYNGYDYETCLQNICYVLCSNGLEYEITLYPPGTHVMRKRFNLAPYQRNSKLISR
jgi:hypothetical protein